MAIAYSSTMQTLKRHINMAYTYLNALEYFRPYPRSQKVSYGPMLQHKGRGRAPACTSCVWSTEARNLVWYCTNRDRKPGSIDTIGAFCHTTCLSHFCTPAAQVDPARTTYMYKATGRVTAASWHKATLSKQPQRATTKTQPMQQGCSSSNLMIDWHQCNDTAGLTGVKHTTVMTDQYPSHGYQPLDGPSPIHSACKPCTNTKSACM